MLIHTERLTLLPFSTGMAYSVHLNSLDDDNRRFLPDEVFESEADALETLSYLISCYGDFTKPQVYAVILGSSYNEPQIGHVQLVPCDYGFEVGYHIGAAYTGHGYATEALGAFMPVVMKAAGIDTVSAVCLSENAASLRVLEKCGFVRVFSGIGFYQGRKEKIIRFEFKI